MGYIQSSNSMMSFLKSANGFMKSLKFCIFDAPQHPGNYASRHSHASNAIEGCDEHICMIPIQRCLGFEHLNTLLHEVTEKNGEGLVAFHPDQAYTSGRTSRVLKIKTYLEEDVQFLECNPNSYTFICKQSNGATCVVKCGGWDYSHPPKPGTVLSVRYDGLWKKSQKLKYPYFLKVKMDRSWDEVQRDFQKQSSSE